jgi:uncharacterized protein with GYD domain
MPTYIVLANMTQQGIQSIKESPQRRSAREEAAKQLGITLVGTYLTMGAYDVVMVVDAPDGEAIAKFVLQIGMRGNLSTQTLRAFTEEEAEALLRDV